MADAPSTTDTPTDAPTLPTCRCGHDRTHHFARPRMRYGWMAWILLFSGASATPREIIFTCGRCGEVIDHVTDPAVLRDFLNH